jgi:hypothetical protein
MALSRVGQASAAANSVAISAAEGDLVVVFAYRSGNNTAPTLNGDYTNIANGANSAGGTNSSYRIGFRVAPSGGVSDTGTWTNATHIAAIVMRGQRVAGAIGNGNASTGNNSQSSIVYEPVSLTGGQAGQWLLAFGARSTGHADVATAPTGLANHTSAPATPLIAGHSSNGIRTTNWPQTSVSVGGTAAKHLSYVLEVLAEPMSAAFAATVPMQGMAATVAVEGAAAEERFGPWSQPATGVTSTPSVTIRFGPWSQPASGTTASPTVSERFGPWSAPVTGVTASLAPGAPTGLTATPGSASVLLEWTKGAGATGYRIERRTL